MRVVERAFDECAVDRSGIHELDELRRVANPHVDGLYWLRGREARRHVVGDGARAAKAERRRGNFAR